MIRQSKFAGTFYPASKKDLVHLIETCFLSRNGPGQLPSSKAVNKKIPTAIVCPHAGYQYSGSVAAWAYLEASKRRKESTVILIGPNHSGAGADIAVYPPGTWVTPLGQILVNESIVNNLASIGLTIDETGHNHEHSIEVQIPFLQYIYGSNFQIVCISMLDQSMTASKKLSASLAKVLAGEDFLIVATSDLSHYVAEQIAIKQDSELLRSFKSNNLDIIFERAGLLHASACGIGPVATAINTSVLRGAEKVEILKYETSAATTGDKASVVGYSALAIY